MEIKKSVISDNLWHHITVVFSGSVGSKLYIDGQYFGQAPTFRNPTSTNGNLAIGAYNSGSYRLNGCINDFRIYDEALSESAIHELAQGLVLHYPLNGNGCGNLVPSDYQRVEYLESTGTQYIDTGIIADHTLKVYSDRIDYTPDGNDYNEGAIWYDGSNAKRWHLYSPGLAGLGITERIGTNIEYGSRYCITVDAVNKYVEVNSIKTAINYTSSCDTEMNYWIFRRNGSTDSLKYYRKSKLYNFKMWSNNKLAAHFIPCYRKSDGKPGLWDTVSNTFKTNSGSGEFLLGPSVGLPREYQQVEYIESTTAVSEGVVGIGTYLYLPGVVYNSSTIAECKFQRLNTTGDAKIFGNGIMGLCTLGGKYRIKNTGFTLTNINYDTNPHIVRCGASIGYLIDNTSIASSFSMSSSWTNLMLFSLSYRTDTDLPSLNSSFSRIFFYRQFNNSIAVVDLIPCYRKYDSKSGMYDVINNIFYTNAGSGEFIIGPKLRMSTIETKIHKTNQLFNISSYNTWNSGHGLQWTKNKIDQTYSVKGTTIDWSGKYDTMYPDFGSGQTSIINHYYAFIIKKLNVKSGDIELCGLQGGSSPQNIYIDVNKIRIFKTTTAGNMNAYVNVKWVANTEYDIIFKLGLVDLTDIFGSGNEPTSYTQVQEKCPWILECEDYSPQGSRLVVPQRNLVLDPWNKELDISGYHNNGTRNGTINYSTNTVRYNLSTLFPSGANYILSDSGSMSFIDLSHASISVWFNPQTTPSGWTGSYGIGCAQSATTKQFAVSNYTGRFTVHTVTGSTWRSTSYGSTLTNGTWYHLAATLNGTTLKMYLNGALVKTETIDWGSSTVHSTTRAEVNNDLGGNPEYGNSMAADFKIYATTLSDDDILKLYNQRNDN